MGVLLELLVMYEVGVDEERGGGGDGHHAHLAHQARHEPRPQAHQPVLRDDRTETVVNTTQQREYTEGWRCIYRSRVTIIETNLVDTVLQSTVPRGKKGYFE